MSDEDSGNEIQHGKLLADVRKLDSKKPTKKKKRMGIETSEETDNSKQISAQSLVAGLSSARHLDELKKSLKQAGRQHRTLYTPLHKNVRDKLERQVAYKSVRTDLNKWQDIIKANRLADHLEFPLNQETIKPKTAAERINDIQPRTPLEIETAKILASSKNNLKSGEMLTQAEQELIKAMSLSEAKQKLSELRKMRLLLSARESKFRRWKKIKSKQFHRRLKKQKHKELLKEFEDLKTKDPEAALEKLELLERDRIQERASLRHRGTGKWAKGLRKLAKNNPELREELSKHYREGKQRGEKQAGVSDSSDESDSNEKELDDELLEKLFTAEDPQTAEQKSDEFLLSLRDASAAKSNPWLKASLAKVKNPASAAVGQKSKATVAQPSDEPLVPLDNDWGGVATGSESATQVTTVDQNAAAENTPKKKRKKLAKKSAKSNSSAAVEVMTIGDGEPTKNSPTKPPKAKRTKKESKPISETKRPEESLDTLFDNLQSDVLSAATAEVRTGRRRAGKVPTAEDIDDADELSDLPSDVDSDAEEDSDDPLAETLERVQTLEQADQLEKSAVEKKSKSKPGRKARKQSNKQAARDKEANVDPRALLLQNEQAVDQAKLIQVAPELIEQMEAGTSQASLLAEAFADDDVIADFEAAKKTAEQAEKPKDVDLSLPGWGDWAGHNLAADSAKAKRKRKRFTIKAPEQAPRRDTRLGNVIISEQAGQAIKKLQVSDLPFPYKSVADFERSIRQPIGPEWNTFSGHQSLTKPRVNTATGRIIRPMSKQVTFQEHTAAPQSDSD